MKYVWGMTMRVEITPCGSPVGLDQIISTVTRSDCQQCFVLGHNREITEQVASVHRLNLSRMFQSDGVLPHQYPIPHIPDTPAQKRIQRAEVV